MKHLNPRQGITTCDLTPLPSSRFYDLECETPESPPGDYNRLFPLPPRRPGTLVRVKHLNPRQGITTHGTFSTLSCWPLLPQCETPESPPGDYNPMRISPIMPSSSSMNGVKHLNPRQGITTMRRVQARCVAPTDLRVKHLNPRQGITTSSTQAPSPSRAGRRCETPESPPGDYNSSCTFRRSARFDMWRCETPESPPGDYNTSSRWAKTNL